MVDGVTPSDLTPGPCLCDLQKMSRDLLVWLDGQRIPMGGHLSAFSKGQDFLESIFAFGVCGVCALPHGDPYHRRWDGCAECYVVARQDATIRRANAHAPNECAQFEPCNGYHAAPKGD